MAVQRVLTGITTSGTPHLGNYAGAIRPAIAASLSADVQSFYFLADYHALIKVQDPARVQQSTLEIAASWLACGLDPDRVWFYRQSDIPEISELTWLLTCVAGKGLLNRAHAYKAAVDKNSAEGNDDDAGITAGLFMYPVLMAADILLFGAHKVPVGRDQVQHIEMARDFGARFNHIYGEHFVLPEAAIEESVATLPGLDGRKMSKSYDNTIALFAKPADLKKQIMGLVTDSKKPGEAKQVDGSALFQLYQAFASESQTQAMRTAFADGIAWGEAKHMLFESIDAQIAPMREHYESLMAKPERIEDILQAGGQKARAIATPFLKELRYSVGLRDLRSKTDIKIASDEKQALPVFKQYREKDGKFYFKLSHANGTTLLQSKGFENPREAGSFLAKIKAEGKSAWHALKEVTELSALAEETHVLDALDAIFQDAIEVL
ncbi:MAG: tryptophan--tRNA ligase [Arenimonas sp.]|nr:tryptophan--tRNA ligase [Arenimonas sp.]